MPNGQSLAQLLLLAGLSPEMVAAMNPDAQRASWTPAPAPSPDTSLALQSNGNPVAWTDMSRLNPTLMPVRASGN